MAAPSHMEVVALEMPGRGCRSEEPGILTEKDLNSFLDEAVAAVLTSMSEFSGDVVFCGLSMGCCVVSYLYCRLSEQGMAGRVTLLALAGRQPVCISVPQSNGNHPTAEDLTAIAAATGMSSTDGERSRAWKLEVEPRLRQDLWIDTMMSRVLHSKFKELATVCVPGEGSSCQTSVMVLAGLSDSMFPFAQAPSWAKDLEAVGLTGDFMMAVIGKGHEFLRDHSMDIFRLISCHKKVVVPTPAPAKLESAGTGLTRKLACPLYKVTWSNISSRRRIDANGDATKEYPTVHLHGYTDPLTDDIWEAVWRDEVMVIVVHPCPGDDAQNGRGQLWGFFQMIKVLLEKENPCRVVIIHEPGVEGSLVLGASKCVPYECPDIRCHRVCVRDVSDGKMVALAIKCALFQPADEHQDLRIFPGKLGSSLEFFAPTLVPVAIQTSSETGSASGPFSGEGCYLVTGGTGGLGWIVVDWLLNRHGVAPNRIVITTRQLKYVHPRGVRVLCGVDLSVPPQAPLFAEVGPVCGVFHLAGILDDGLILNMTEERAWKPVPSKISVMHLLNIATEHAWPLEWLVNFSSTTSLFGFPGQANYAAANAVLDDLDSLVQTDCNIATINWSAWAEAGMAKVGTRAYEVAVQQGDTPLETESALGCLGEVVRRVASGLDGARSQYSVVDADWGRCIWKDAAAVRLLTSDAAEKSSANGNSPDCTGADDEHNAGVESFLRARLSVWEPEAGWLDLGMDSLDDVQIRNEFKTQFGVAVPRSLFARAHLTLAQIRDELESLLLDVDDGDST